eukprot:gnl/Ergobibamus_cyprinoides/1354.p3 GENE.gnl/Ergobibamus_cyprinoides/1354~~gnl/Ergobibamus_cyprinoides/1354.p3  ORF type:complete len:109 (+),score=25.84 gnl/Ergobibamus_cyprinoides/1354:324-650(+)
MPQDCPISGNPDLAALAHLFDIHLRCAGPAEWRADYNEILHHSMGDSPCYCGCIRNETVTTVQDCCALPTGCIAAPQPMDQATCLALGGAFSSGSTCVAGGCVPDLQA